MTRALVVWCPDWAVVAAGVPPGMPAAVVVANRVLAVSSSARAAGVQVGQRRRAAQAACPGLEVIVHDAARDARAFEPVMTALETFTPLVELTRPGACACGSRGPSRYAGGDKQLAARVRACVIDVLGERVGVAGFPGVGLADGMFAARLAAQRSSRELVAVVVPPGQSARFIAPFPVEALARADVAIGLDDLVAVLPRLGVGTLGALAALDVADVVGRFGALGRLAHRVASGGDDRPLDARRPPPELVARLELDPPAERVDRVAFAVRALAEELHGRLSERGLACTRLVIELETEHGESRVRCWRHEGTLTAAAIAERARWQLEGWLQTPHRGTGHIRSEGGTTDHPSAGVSVVRLVPDEVIADDGRQLGFWGGQTQADERAWRGVARVGELVGRDTVAVPVWRGGRGPGEQLVLIPADTVDLAARVGRCVIPDDAAPWPGRVPAPSPAVVLTDPEPADLLDHTGASVAVSGRLVVSAPPAMVQMGTGPRVAVEAWSGPWGADERWWDPRTRRRRARLQVCTADGRGLLLAVEQGRWWCEAIYD